MRDNAAAAQAGDDDVWVGVDLGTQGVKVLAATGTGRVLGRGSAPLDDHRAGPRHEQDPEQWWTALVTACRTALAEVPAAAVRRVAVCATSGTLVVADHDLRPLLPALMYDDLRAADDGADLLDRVDESVWRRLGVRPQPSWAVAKLAWLGRNARGELARGVVLHQADFVTSRLAGELLPSDTSHALKSGADPVSATWPDEIRAVLGLPEHALPRLVRPGGVIGEVSRAAAEVTGLPAGAAIVAGMTDGCASQLATGALTVGSWNSVLGTTLVFKGVAERQVFDTSVYSHLGPDGRWWPGGASSTGAGVLTTAFPGADLAALDRDAPLDEPAGCVSYPLAGRGERFPFVAADAEGFTLGQPRGELDRYVSVLQGVAYLERLCVAHLGSLGAPVGESIRVTGGGVRSAPWTQLRADVLGRRLEVPAVTEPAFGMAVLAASSEYGLAASAERMVRVDREFLPRPEVGDRLAAGYHRLADALAQRGWLPPTLLAEATAG
ncbi:FGGY-family carbohydrate kinase [Goodfellowiella coeruleoviolacea]|uniref:Sugar (Pentulose or hexulose) kinase n=1 Tax=Goodfellowiella coeruleoviolacea TaxID=334858 RepID=A0AAE3GCD3_9PSEU|nr:FGGY family carbohydrate kinase [Goodfellowiella coeruleoviolacea]MCP2164534.1 Sugar (pentulose or hexulose) kinase [Goodfellowiella coeruleoviolacea]